MKTICVMRDVFKAMARFEDSFEKVYKTLQKCSGFWKKKN